VVDVVGDVSSVLSPTTVVAVVAPVVVSVRTVVDGDDAVTSVVVEKVGNKVTVVVPEVDDAGTHCVLFHSHSELLRPRQSSGAAVETVPDSLP